MQCTQNLKHVVLAWYVVACCGFTLIYQLCTSLSGIARSEFGQASNFFDSFDIFYSCQNIDICRFVKLRVIASIKVKLK